MKNLFLSLILSLLGFACYATSGSIEILNNSQCDVYIQIRGSKACPKCDLDYVSNLMLIPGGGTVVTIPNTMGLGGTFPTSSPTFINSVRIFNGSPQCVKSETWTIGDMQCNYPPQLNFYALNQNCKVECRNLTAQWLPRPCEGMARLIIS